jgi:hypothetical protein
MVENGSRDHLFISYATEDTDLTKWLALKLTIEGYAVWCDMLKLLGGESYPKNIDDAIKNRTFRFIALLSRASLSKPNPLKERTLALNIARKRNEDFLIPLNVDRLHPTELDWMTSDLTFIPFYKSWAAGLDQLLKKLSSVNAPKVLKNGKEVAAGNYLQNSFIQQRPEIIYTNCLNFLKIPESIKIFNLKKSLSKNEIHTLSQRWAFYKKDSKTVLAFQSPSDHISDTFSLNYGKEVRWLEKEGIYGIPIRHIVSNLLYKSIQVKCFQKGLKMSETGKIYFPFGLLTENKLRFEGYTGKKTWILVASERHRAIPDKPPQTFFYHLSPKFKIKRGKDVFYIAQLLINLYLTGDKGEPLNRRSETARQKAIRKSWWNNHFLNRSIAIVSFLSDGDDKITIGDISEEQIVLSGKFITYEAPVSITEGDIAEGLESMDEEILESINSEELEE